MQCGLCNSEVSALVQSHIIPRALMTEGMGPGENLILAGTNSLSKRSATGVWSRIVCDRCEKSFHIAEEHLIKVVRSLGAAKLAFEGNLSILETANPVLLQRGILGVLFRAHLSDHPLYSRIQLGAQAESLRSYLASDAEIVPKPFRMFLRHMTGLSASTTFCPFRERWSGVNAYRVYFPHLTAMIKVDWRPFPAPLCDFQVENDRVPVAMRSDRFSPSEQAIVGRIVDRSGDEISRIFGKLKAGRFKSGSLPT